MRITNCLFLLFLVCLTFQACSQTNTTTPPATTTAPPEPPKPPAYASDKEGWLVDLDEAYAISVKEKKPILANFTGSDWCGWCKRLDADVFSKPEFKEWAKKNVVLLEVDFPKRKQIPQKNMSQNAAMQSALQITGYPTIWVFNLAKDANTGNYQINQLGKTGYNPSATEFVAIVDKYVHP